MSHVKRQLPGWHVGGAVTILAALGGPPMAQCLELSLLPGIDPADFERHVLKEVFPAFKILRRNVRGHRHKLLKLEGAAPAPRYVWVTLVDLVGPTPATAGQGPTDLVSSLDVTEVSHLVRKFATVAAFTEVTPG